MKHRLLNSIKSRIVSPLKSLRFSPIAAKVLSRLFAGITNIPRGRYFTISTRLRKLSLDILHQIRNRVNTHEFWLGFGFGVATRTATRLAILAAFPETPRLATAASFVACAGAGLATSAITHLVRTYYRNSKLPKGAEKEKIHEHTREYPDCERFLGSNI